MRQCLFCAIMMFGLSLSVPALASDKNPVGYENVALVQEYLYEMGYRIEKVDGVMGPNTGRAIAAWREDNGYSRASYLTDMMMDEIRRAANASFPPSRRWSAVSVSLGDAKYGISWGQLTRSGAALVAKRRCENESRAPDKCDTVTAHRNAWIVAITCNSARGQLISVAAHGSGATQAESSALRGLREKGYSPGECTTFMTLTPGGPEGSDNDGLEEWWEE